MPFARGGLFCADQLRREDACSALVAHTTARCVQVVPGRKRRWWTAKSCVRCLNPSGAIVFYCRGSTEAQIL